MCQTWILSFVFYSQMKSFVELRWPIVGLCLGGMATFLVSQMRANEVHFDERSEHSWCHGPLQSVRCHDWMERKKKFFNHWVKSIMVSGNPASDLTFDSDFVLASPGVSEQINLDWHLSDAALVCRHGHLCKKDKTHLFIRIFSCQGKRTT